MEFINRRTIVLAALLVLSPVAHPVALEPPLVVASIEQSPLRTAPQPAAHADLDLALDDHMPADWRKLEQLALSSPPAVLDFIVLDPALPDTSDLHSRRIVTRESAVGVLPLLGSMLLLAFGLSLVLGQFGGHRVRHLRPFQQLNHARSQFQSGRPDATTPLA